MQRCFHRPHHRLGATQGQVLEGLGLEHGEGHVRGSAQMCGHLGVGARRGVATVEVTVGVVVAGPLVEQLGVVDQLTEVEHQDAGSLAVGQQHGEAVEALGHRFELAHRRRLVDHHPAAHRHRQGDHLPEVMGRAGEDGQPPRGGAVDATAHILLDALEVAGHRGRTVRPGSSGAQDPFELVLAVGPATQTPPVHIEVATGHRGILPPEPGQFANGSFGDDGHGASRLSVPRGPDRRQTALAALGEPGQAGTTGGMWRRSGELVGQLDHCGPLDADALGPGGHHRLVAQVDDLDGLGHPLQLVEQRSHQIVALAGQGVVDDQWH